MAHVVIYTSLGLGRSGEIPVLSRNCNAISVSDFDRRNGSASLHKSAKHCNPESIESECQPQARSLKSVF
jgi:hypothetical protein